MSMYDVNKTIRQIIVNWYKNVMFLDTEYMTLDEFVNHIIFKLIKKSYELSDEPKSIRGHLIDKGFDTEDKRVMYNRAMRFAQYYRDRQYEDHSAWGLNIDELKAPDMKVMENKVSGYKLTDMQFFELTQMHELELLKASSTKRICDTKKISNRRFKEMFAEFDTFVENLQKEAISDKDVIFNTIAYFTLEWTMGYELVYAMAEKAEELDFPAPDFSKIVWLCGDVTLPKEMPTLLNLIKIGEMRTQSRFCLYRQRLIPYVLDCEKDWDIVQIQLIEYLRLKVFINTGKIEDKSLAEWFTSVTTEKERADFIREYFWLFGIHKSKVWTNKRIRYARKIFEGIYRNVPPPQIL